MKCFIFYQEEFQATEKHGDESDNEYEKSEKRPMKKRFHAQGRKVHKDYYKKDVTRRKRHPSLNDPPSYDAVMEYPNASSDESDESPDHDTSNRRLLPAIEGSDTSLGDRSDRTYQNVYREGAIATFRTLDTHIPVAHSDGDLTLANLASRRGRYLPRLAKGMVTPPAAMSEELTSGPFSRIPRTDSWNVRDSKETVVARDESNVSPFRVTAVVHQTTPQSPEHAGSQSGSITGSRPGSVTSSRPGSGKGSRPGSRSGGNSQSRPAYATIGQAHPVSTLDSGIYTMEKNPMDIPLTSFRGRREARGPPPPIPVKPPVLPTHRNMAGRCPRIMHH